MKKYIFIILFLFLSLSPAKLAQAATPTLTPNPTSSASPTKEALNTKLSNQINQLKDKIASRVSELNLVEKRAIIGIITNTSTTQITLADQSGNSRIVDVDEITKFTSATKASFGLSDLSKGNKISVLGLYNKQSKRILARFIQTSVDPVFLSGAISEIDSKNITLKLMAEDKKETKIDIIQPSTKISEFIKEDGLTKIAFSKLEIADRISVVGYPDKKDSTLIVASRIIVFPESTKNPKISIQVPTPTKSVTPATSTSSAVRRPSVTSTP